MISYLGAQSGSDASTPFTTAEFLSWEKQGAESRKNRSVFYIETIQGSPYVRNAVYDADGDWLYTKAIGGPSDGQIKISSEKYKKMLASGAITAPDEVSPKKLAVTAGVIGFLIGLGISYPIFKRD